MITREEAAAMDGKLEYMSAEILSSSPSHRMVRTLLQYSDSDFSNASSSFDLQIAITVAIVLTVLLCVIALHTLLRHLIRHDRCVGDDLNGVVDPTVRSVGSEKNDTISVVSFSVYKSPLQSLAESESSECAICLGDFNTRAGEDERLQLPNCKHCFHTQCIVPWLSSHTSCPTCRDEILTRPQTPASTYSWSSAGASSPRVGQMLSSPAFRSQSLYRILQLEDVNVGGRVPASTILFAEALTSPSLHTTADYYINR